MSQQAAFEPLTEEQEENVYESRFSDEFVDSLRRLLNQSKSSNFYFEGSGSLLEAVASFGNPDGVKLLLEQRADPNGVPPDSCGMSPLAACADCDDAASIECVRLLLKSGANPNGTHIDRESPLVRAMWVGAIGCCRLILEAGGRPKRAGGDREALKEFRKSAELTDKQKQTIVDLFASYGITVA